MIGFNALGKMGLLGNQMFQFSSLKGIAKNNGYQYCIPPAKGQQEWVDNLLFNPFKLSCTDQLNVQFVDPGRDTISENGFCFDEKLFNNCPDWVNLQGYFQTEKYFKHIESEIRKDFEFKDEILEPCKEMMSQFNTAPVSLHIRRTDYLTNPNHTALGLDYYKKALEQFGNEQVIVFSDDPEWVQSQEFFQGDEFLISEFDSRFNHTAATNDGRQKSLIPFYDLYMMSQCDGGIIANSSFSWWGAWLIQNPTQPIVAPNPWFGVKYSHYNMNDLIPDRWVTLKY